LFSPLRTNLNHRPLPQDQETAEKHIYNYRKATDSGILKIMSEMAISTLASYKGGSLIARIGGQ
jgi:glutamate synthase domain-containing protein 2